MSSIYNELRLRASQAAAGLALPLAWEGDPFVVPATAHLRGRILFDDSQTASLGAQGLTRISGHIDFTVVVPAGDDAQAAALGKQLAAGFGRGEYLPFDEGGATFTTPHVSGPSGDGKRISVSVAVNFYAFSK